MLPGYKMKKSILVIILFLTNVMAFNVFEPESQIVPKKQIYYFPAEKIFFYIHFISARYGKPFTDQKVKTEFEKQNWYKVNDNFSESLLNDTDKKNIKKLTGIYNSIISKTKELKELKTEVIWSKEVNFKHDNRKKRLTYIVKKINGGFHVEYEIEDNTNILYSDKYQLKTANFENKCHGYFYDGIYEAVASNFEFIDIEFFPDGRIESSLVYWFTEKKGLSEEEAQKRFSQLKTKIGNHKGSALYSGAKGGGLFPPEYIYLDDKNGFIQIYCP